MNIAYIYKLVDPREPDLVRYIGKSVNLSDRLTNHIRVATKNERTNNVNVWLREILAENIRPKIILVETVIFDYPEEWGYIEDYYINHFRNLGHPITNMFSGGLGAQHTEKSKAKMSQARTGKSRTFTAEHKANMGKAQLGKKRGPHSPLHIEKVACQLRGRKQSAESIQKRVESRKRNQALRDL